MQLPGHALASCRPHEHLSQADWPATPMLDAARADNFTDLDWSRACASGSPRADIPPEQFVGWAAATDCRPGRWSRRMRQL